MAYDPLLADRIRELIVLRASDVVEKTMFGGLSFMVNDKMCVSTKNDRIMLRLSPETYEIELQGDGVSPMIHSGREMKGFLFVTGPTIQTKAGLSRWVNLALDYNEVALPSPGKRTTSSPKPPTGKKKK
ncbi:TfoX/Sxy family protein [Dinghuibacter silviterrae]|uniref:TfoX-like protein n=1 Tax=Dinghuibacter silviterrae TaxID=1539049 RepID=A0A4R8DYV1_9BACT|nr:TfoX/Sxy family protein [Dinghuibacter silviterrae]TDX02391.1 TfoX-like protein [Dinghuibacter silviterrae]